MTLQTRSIILLAAVTILGACSDRDPYRRTDVWRPTGANAANIAAMLADPNDMVRGRGTTRADTRGSTIAVDRVWTDRPKSMAPAGGQGGQAGGGAGAGAGAGAGSPPGG